MRAIFHSTRMKITMQTPPRVNMEITMGEAQRKYVPPPETGMRRRRMALVLKMMP